MNTTLPTDSEARKAVPIVSGCLDYFPAALSGVARISHAGNQKHNPGEPLHHARGKSTDHADCIVRHLLDLQGLLASLSRHDTLRDGEDWVFEVQAAACAEASALAWRALALSQELHERFGAPLAPGARLPAPIASEVRVQFTEAPAVSAEQIEADAPFIVPAIVPLRIEAGKRYVRRDGTVSQPMRTTQSETFPFADNRESYTWWGSAWLSGGAYPTDLAADYVEPVAKCEWAAKDPSDNSYLSGAGGGAYNYTWNEDYAARFPTAGEALAAAYRHQENVSWQAVQV